MMRLAQNFKCPICERHETEVGRIMVVDHCHKTGKVRGLLCHLCNVGIGNLQENIDTLQKAINYLSIHKLEVSLNKEALFL